MLAKSLAAFSFISLLGSSFAAPTPAAIPEPQPVSGSATGDLVTITLIDATQHHWPVSIPSTQTWTPTNVVESISHVHIENTGYVPCAFFGVDGTVVVSFPGDVKDLDVGPPQTIIGGICGPFGGSH